MNAMSHLPAAAIELVGLTKRFSPDGKAAVDSINLRIASGSYCCLLGPSGCGKSTTLRMVAGHETVSDGAGCRARHGHDVPKLRLVSAPERPGQRGF